MCPWERRSADPIERHGGRIKEIGTGEGDPWPAGPWSGSAEAAPGLSPCLVREGGRSTSDRVPGDNPTSEKMLVLAAVVPATTQSPMPSRRRRIRKAAPLVLLSCQSRLILEMETGVALSLVGGSIPSVAGRVPRVVALASLEKPDKAESLKARTRVIGGGWT